MRDKLILLSETMLHKDYDVQFQKEISDLKPQGDWRQDELIGGRLPVAN
jgi:hypothetical protein